ncbi:hypothetical protein [Bosea sp. (in: a-proteobacteria)]|uniref:hypothetical protein n=1 Tax=Bosea sp. (in: a-proteobacteria) TaxID=1871050 RepID=UPI004034BAA5
MTTATVTPIERHPLAGGPHDVGGAEGGPLDRHEHSYELWERQTHAVMLLLCRKGKLTVDELRRGVEALSEAATKVRMPRMARQWLCPILHPLP